PLGKEAGAARGLEVELDRVGTGAAGLFDKARRRLDAARGADRDEYLALGEDLINRVEAQWHLAEPDHMRAQLALDRADRAALVAGQIVIPDGGLAAGRTARLQ